VLAGLTYLQSRSDIAADRIGFYGTSNGGYIAPLAAARSRGRVAFITVRSGSARRVGDNIAYEMGNDLRSQGFTEAQVTRGVAIRQRTDYVSRKRSLPRMDSSSPRSTRSPGNRIPGPGSGCSASAGDSMAVAT
jgi:dipeptidyl aminopeptidase/acylaminoacyl peptidase